MHAFVFYRTEYREGDYKEDEDADYKPEEDIEAADLNDTQDEDLEEEDEATPAAEGGEAWRGQDAEDAEVDSEDDKVRKSLNFAYYFTKDLLGQQLLLNSRPSTRLLNYGFRIHSENLLHLHTLLHLSENTVLQLKLGVQKTYPMFCL